MSWFRYKAPREYAIKLANIFGAPTGQGTHFVIWENVPNYDWIMVRDEYVAHDFPKSHHDFVYSAVTIKGIKTTHACRAMRVSGSIIVDLLKQQVQARCGGLTANDVTLSFVRDIVKGKVKASKVSYAKRINESIVTHPKLYYTHTVI